MYKFKERTVQHLAQYWKVYRKLLSDSTLYDSLFKYLFDSFAYSWRTSAAPNSCSCLRARWHMLGTGSSSCCSSKLDYRILAGICIRCFASVKLCILVLCVHLHLIHKALEWVVLTVFVPFPNSSMRTNELPVLLLRAWAIWRETNRQWCITHCSFLFCVNLCLAVGRGWFIKCLNRWREWEKTWRALGAGGSPLFPHPLSLTDINTVKANVCVFVCMAPVPGWDLS